MNEAGKAGPIRVVLADDHDLVRAGIRMLLLRIGGICIEAEARNGKDLVQLVADLQPDLVLTDLSMPVMDGFEAMTRIHEAHPDVRLVALSMNDTAAHVKRAVACGARGYLMKDAAPADLELTVRGVMANGHYFPSAVAALLLKPAPIVASDMLTARQLQVLTLLAQGQCAKKIGHGLGLSPKTVDVHRGHIMERLQLHDVASLTRYAVREGLVSP